MMIERVLAIVADVAGAGRRTRGITAVDFKALAQQEAAKPVAHLAGRADHQRALPGAGAARHYAGLFLGGQGTADQQPHQRFRQFRVDTDAGGTLARPENDLPFALEIAGGLAGAAFDARNLAALFLPFGDQVQKLAVDLVQPLS